MSVVINGSAGVTTNSGAVYDGLQRGTAVTASGTSVDFTGIPSWVKRITVMFSGVSTNGASNILVQIGAGGVTSSGYVSVSAYSGGTNLAAGTNSTSGFVVNTGTSAATTFYGAISIFQQNGNTWVSSQTFGVTQGASLFSIHGGGNVTLSGTLDRIRITTVNGTDQFDAGTINIIYE